MSLYQDGIFVKKKKSYKNKVRCTFGFNKNVALCKPMSTKMIVITA